ncbi:hypothetical protein LJC11_03865 [Bacteroidales bacterium OttesenSCG-928-I21]|nr:hypothetical protein [Bacteroidales bacterium OttesenSCG-928-I21]
MDNLIDRLQEEAGLTEEQAIKAVVVVKNYMEKEGISIDWKEFFKNKYEKYMDKSKSYIEQFKRKVDDFSDEIGDKIEDATIQAKRSARDLSKKVYEKLNDEEDEQA